MNRSTFGGKPPCAAALLISAVIALSGCKRPENAPTTGMSSSDTGAPMLSNDTGSPPLDHSVAAHQPATVSPEQLVTQQPTAAGSISSQAPDRQFAAEAALAGLYELTVARMAVDKAADPALKRYAAQLIEQHAEANDKLKLIAQSKGILLPDALPAAQQQKLDALSRASGNSFDQQFIRVVGLQDQQTDIALFEKQARDGRDVDLKRFAQINLPVRQDQLKTARQLAAGTGVQG